jgi:tetratricopeptide (TPR) repeat protein
MLKDMLKTLRNNAAFTVFLLPVLLLAVTLPAEAQMADEQYLEGCAHYSKGDYEKAALSFSLAIIRNNADEQLYIKRGISLLQFNETERAIADFTEANIINPQVADIWLARSYAITEDYDKALSFLRSHLNSTFRLPEDSIKKDPAFDKLQETPDWHSLWQKDWYSSTEKVISEAEYYIRKRQFDQAISLLDEEISRDPSEQALLLTRGNVHYQQGNYAIAISDYSAVLNKDKSAKGVYAQRALAYLKSGRFKEAVNDYNKAVKEDPGNFSLYLQRGEAYAGQEAWEQAIRDMQLYTKYFKDDLFASYLCGEYYYKAEDYINALRCFNLNLKEDPNNGLYYKARGKTYLKTATYRYALSDLAMSLDLRPDDAETWMFIGICKIQSGDTENGCSDLVRAERMGSTEALKYIVDNCR